MPLLGSWIESFRCALIILVLSGQKIRAGKKSRLFASLAISVQIKLSDSFQSKSQSNVVLRLLLLGYKVQTHT